jgi:hypothetical protein
MHPLRRLFLRFGFDVRRTRIPVDTPQYVSLYGADSVKGRRFYNLGGGRFSHPCWTVIERYPGGQAPPPHVHCDLMDLTPWPVESGKAELVYTSHTLQHVSMDAASFALTEAYRMLKPGGLLRVAVPDILLSYKAWRRNDAGFFHWIGEYDEPGRWRKYNLKGPLSAASLGQVFLEDFAATASTLVAEGAEKRIGDEELEELFSTRPLEEALDYCIALCPPALQSRFPFHRMNWFHEKKLLAMLRRAGFKDPYRSGYLQSAAPVLRNAAWFDRTYPELTLFAEAAK